MAQPRGMTRRAMLGTLGAVGVAAAAGVTLAPRAAGAQALGQNEPVDAALKRVFGGKAMKDGSGIIKLDIPLIAENGAVVPVSVEVNAPMTPQSYVKRIYVVADKNRIPIVTRAVLTPDSRTSPVCLLVNRNVVELIVAIRGLLVGFRDRHGTTSSLRLRLERNRVPCVRVA